MIIEVVGQGTSCGDGLFFSTPGILLSRLLFVYSSEAITTRMQEDLQELVSRARNGDQPAFKTLVTMYQQVAFRVSFRILCNEEEAREAVQESFIRIWKSLGSCDTRKDFRPWAYRIFTNTAIDHLRAVRRRNQVPVDTVPETALAPDLPDPEKNLGNKELAMLIRGIAGELPEKQRLVFILRDLEGLPSEEVRQVLGLTKTSVKSNLWHARLAIRKKLSALVSYERINQ